MVGVPGFEVVEAEWDRRLAAGTHHWCGGAANARFPACTRSTYARRPAAQARLRNPFGRLTTPRDVADAIYLLATDEARWINGALLRVDGGEHVSGAPA